MIYPPRRSNLTYSPHVPLFSEPYNTGHLNVGDGHRVYYEQCGNPTGSPALFLHGGPGGGCGERSRRFFDPDVYRIVCLDQRGCGRSLPNAGGEWEKSIYENNTGKLVEDLEALRNFLEVEKWTVVLGGSWGSTLTLSYAIAYPGSMEDLILRGVFLFSPEEVDHLFQVRKIKLYVGILCRFAPSKNSLTLRPRRSLRSLGLQDGSTSSQNPEAWEMYAKYIEDTSHDFEAERTNFLGAYYKRMTGQDETVRRAAASAFVGYELSISKSFVDMKRIKEVLGDISHLIPFALFEVIYMLNAGFMSRGYLLANVNKIVEAGHRVR